MSLKDSADTTTAPTALDLPRVGQINFSNCLPINLPIEKGVVALRARLIEGHPQQLNALMAEGELEVSSTSSFLALSRPDLQLLPDLSISSFGPVGSVLFFSKSRLKTYSTCRVAVPLSSATSVKLVELMLRLESGVRPELAAVEHPSLESTSSNADFDGALLIGDEALALDERLSSTSYRIDLGEWWCNRFNLPMVFGLFVARKDFREQYGESYRHISEALALSRSIGTTEMLDQVIDAATSMTGLSRERMRRYFVENLNWRLDEEHKESLYLFARLLSAEGLF